MNELPILRAQLILDTIDINTARALGTDIRQIRCNMGGQEALELLKYNLYKWAENSGLELDEQTEVSSYSYGGPAYNGSTKYGRERYETKIFSTFKVTINTDGGWINSIEFNKVYPDDKIVSHPKYDPNKTPSMLNLAYGLKKKYFSDLSWPFLLVLKIPGIEDINFHDAGLKRAVLEKLLLKQNFYRDHNLPENKKFILDEIDLYMKGVRIH